MRSCQESATAAHDTMDAMGSEHTVATRAARILGAGVVAGAATMAWAASETRRYQLREYTVPTLPPNAAPLRLLHLSDLHMTPRQSDKARWLTGLASLEPHLTIVTGDFLGHLRAVPFVVEALSPLLAGPGAFVFGSNDYWAPGRGNPLNYLRGPSEMPAERQPLPWGDLLSELTGAGWADLNNRSTSFDVDGVRIELRGVDDPHIERDDYPRVAGPFSPEADVRIGVAHAPYLRVLDAMDRDGADLILAGHTHGGQVCLPGGRAIVTNCDIDPARARGLSRHREGQLRAGDRSDGAWLNVSAGLGQAPTYPFRVFCRPEVSLLTLVGA